MSRAKRSMKRRQFRFSLDPMDPVEGEALRQIDEIADQAKEMFESISQDEADRYAFKRILLGLLKDRPVELTAPARSAPASISAPAAVASTPAAPQPEAARTPVEQPPKAQEVPVETVGKEGTEEEGAVDGSQTSSAATQASIASRSRLTAPSCWQRSASTPRR